MLNVLLADASKRIKPNVLTTFWPSVPFFPGCGFCKTIMADRPSASVKAPAVLLGTSMASAFKLQRGVVDPTAWLRLCFVVTTLHCGSGTVTNLLPNKFAFNCVPDCKFPHS